MRLGHDLLISVNDKMNSPFREYFFSRNFAYKTLAKSTEFTVIVDNCIAKDDYTRKTNKVKQPALLHIKIIAKLERPQSNEQLNRGKITEPHNGSNKLTTNQQQQNHQLPKHIT